MNINGTPGNDIIVGTSGNDLFNLTQGGNDQVSGGAGNDTFKFGQEFTAADSIDGGTGSDILVLEGNYAGLTLAATTMVNVETIRFESAGSYSLTTNDANVAAGQTLTVTCTDLMSGGSVTFNGSAETDGHFTFYGALGSVNFTGGAQADNFLMQNTFGGGSVTLNGGGGNDTFNFGEDYNTADLVNGGAGVDTLYIASTQTTLSYVLGGNLTSIDILKVGGGADYEFGTTDALVAAGQTFTVDMTQLGQFDNFSFDGSAEKDGRFHFIAGPGNLTLFTGAGNDIFDLTGSNGAIAAEGGNGNDVFEFLGNMPENVLLDGGAGSDTLTLNGDYTREHDMQGNSLTGIERIIMAAGDNYNFTFESGAILAGQDITINAGALGVHDRLTFDGSARPQGITVLAGAGNDTVTGVNYIDGSKGGTDNFDAETVKMGNTFDSTDQISATTLILAGGSYAHNFTITGSMLPTLVNLTLSAGYAYDIIVDDDMSNSGSTVTTGGATTLDLRGSAQPLTFNGSSGADTLIIDDFNLFSHLVMHGNGGNDTLVLAEKFFETLNFGSSFTSLDTVKVMNDFQATYDMTGHGVTTIDASQLLGGVNGSHIVLDFSTDNIAHTVKSGAGADEITLGNGADTFVYDDGIALDGADRDLIHAFNFYNDKVQFAAVTAIDATLTHGTLNNATFDADLTTAIGTTLAAHSAMLFRASAGDLSGDTFLIVDGNGTAGYQAGHDLVIELDGALNLGKIALSNFTA